MRKKRLMRRVSRQIMTKKVISIILDDFAFYGSLPFFLVITLIAYFVGNTILFQRLLYAFILSMVVIFSIKSIHFKDRPQKEEFNVLVEKILASSFPSSHSMQATGLTLLLILSYPYPWVIAITITFSILLFFQRYITKKHFVIDIIGGIFIEIAEVIFIVKII